MTRSAMTRIPGLCASSALRGGREDRQQPDGVDAEPLQVVQPGGEPAQVAGAVAAGVGEAADQHLIEDGPLVPFRISRLLEGERIRYRLAGARRESAQLSGSRVVVRGGVRLCHDWLSCLFHAV